MRGRKWPLNPKDGEKQYNAVLLPGTIVEARINPEHYLTMGYRNEPLPVRMETRSAFEPHDKANAPVFFNDSGDIHLGGLNYQSSLDRLAGTPYITEESIGLGKVILFLQDPNCRLYWHGLTRLFLNSVILSPAFLQTWDKTASETKLFDSLRWFSLIVTGAALPRASWKLGVEFVIIWCFIAVEYLTPTDREGLPPGPPYRF